MTNGFGAMPDYAAQIPPRDRWCIVAYIRALQLSQDATAADVPAGQQCLRQRLQFRGDPGPGATLPEVTTASRKRRQEHQMSARVGTTRSDGSAGRADRCSDGR